VTLKKVENLFVDRLCPSLRQPPRRPSHPPEVTVSQVRAAQNCEPEVPGPTVPRRVRPRQSIVQPLGRPTIVNVSGRIAAKRIRVSGGLKMSLRTTSFICYIFLVFWDHGLFVVLVLKKEFRSCAIEDVARLSSFITIDNSFNKTEPVISLFRAGSASR